MKKAKFLLCFITILCIAFSSVLTGCGENKTSKGTTNSNSETENSSNDKHTSDQSNEPVTIKYAFWGSPVEKKVVEGICKQFEEKNPGIKVEALHIPSDYESKMNTMIAANNAPDMAYLQSAQAYQLAEAGKLFNVYEMLGKDPEFKLEDYVPQAFYEWAPGKAIGRRIGIAAYALYYSVDAVKEAGVTLPVTQEEALTWDEFVKIAQKLTIDKNGKRADEPGFDPNNIKQYGFTWPNFWVNIYYFLQENDADYISPDGTKFTLDSPQAIEVIQNLADLIHKYHVSPTPVQQKSLPNISTSLATRRVAMQMDGNWNCADLAQAKVNFDIAVLPKMLRSRGIVDCGPIGIFNSTKHLNETWKLYKFAANPEYSLDFYASGISIPVLKKWLTEPELLKKWTDNAAHPKGYVPAMIGPLLNDPVPSPPDYIKNWAKIDAIISPALENVWLGKTTAKEAIAAIKDKVQAEIQGRYNWSSY